MVSVKSLRSVLFIRFGAIGDIAVTLHACESLRHMFPLAQFDYLTSSETKDLISSIQCINHVHHFNYKTTRYRRWFSAVFFGCRSRIRYDAVIDFQNNYISRMISRFLSADKKVFFDRFSPLPVEERVRRTVEQLGILNFHLKAPVILKSEYLDSAKRILHSNGWNGERLLVLNPAGAWPSRHWPIGRYSEVANRICIGGKYRVLFVGNENILYRVSTIKERLNHKALNLVGQTSPGEAFGVISFASLILSEDSGIVPMGWVLRIPTLSLLGSTRYDWAQPIGSFASCFHAGDMSCGGCMQKTCRFGTVECLQRISPGQVYDALKLLMEKSNDMANRIVP